MLKGCRSRRPLFPAVAVACVALLAGLTVPLAAAADDLDDRRRAVQREVAQAEVDLDQTSAELVRAWRSLKAAEARLGGAERLLARRRGAVSAAEALDQETQDRLAAAVAALERQRSAVLRSRRELRVQQQRIQTYAVSTYQSAEPALMALSMVLTSQEPAQLTSQLGSVRSVMEKESAALARLEATQALLSAHEADLEAAKMQVARQRRAAAQNLRRKRVLEAQAVAAEGKVRRLVDALTRARNVAAAAKARDLAQLRALEKERTRISTLLRRRAEEARRRAAQARRRAQQSSTGRAMVATAGRSASTLLRPVNAYITSPYGMRLHPIYKRWTLHDGTDFGAACGTPVKAAASGRVIAVYYNYAYGKRAIIDNGYARGVGLGTAYNHLSSYSTYTGQQVKRGEIIGYVGTTGYSTGCHLHFMVFENGETVDPQRWL